MIIPLGIVGIARLNYWLTSEKNGFSVTSDGVDLHNFLAAELSEVEALGANFCPSIIINLLKLKEL